MQLRSYYILRLVSADPQNITHGFNSLQNALKVIGFKDGQMDDLRSILAGILHLGNVSFVNAGGAQVVDIYGKVINKVNFTFWQSTTIIFKLNCLFYLCWKGKTSNCCVRVSALFVNLFIMQITSTIYRWYVSGSCVNHFLWENGHVKLHHLFLSNIYCRHLSLLFFEFICLLICAFNFFKLMKPCPKKKIIL